MNEDIDNENMSPDGTTSTASDDKIAQREIASTSDAPADPSHDMSTQEPVMAGDIVREIGHEAIGPDDAAEVELTPEDLEARNEANDAPGEIAGSDESDDAEVATASTNDEYTGTLTI